MSRRRNPGSARAERRTGGLAKSGKTNHRRAGYSAAAVLILAAVVAVGVTNRQAAAHPTPRTNIEAEEVVPHAHYQGYPRVQAVYKQAAQIPEVLDGLHCYCECGDHSGHYSLLDCFKSDHGAGCDICLTSVSMAYDLNKEGKSLEEIRAAIDEVFTRYK